MTRLITVGGNGERASVETNMLALVCRRISRPIKWIDLDYPASIALSNPHGDLFGASENVSRSIGVANLRKAVEKSAEPVVLSGYSLGALVVSDFLETYRGPVPIKAVVNLSNPARLRGQSYGHPSFGWGLDGEHGPWPRGLPTFEISNPVDVISSAPKHSPWRRLAVVLRGLDLDDPAQWWAALMETLPELHTLGVQKNWHDPTWWQAYAEAPAWLRGYLFDGQHTAAYGRPLWRSWKNQPISGIDLAASAITAYA